MVQQHSQHPHPSQPAPATLGALRASGHTYRGVKEEIRDNLLAMMRAGQDPFPGIVGFGQTVLPHLERALIAGHDIILLGERGQGKTRLIRTLAGLLDEWTPTVAGCEINDHPYQPACARCRRLATEMGDDLPVSWWHRDDRYGEKLATPDSTHRRRIITPLKDRFGAEIRTHCPLSLTDELTLIRQEADIWTAAELPEHLVEVIARFTRGVRESPAVDARSGVSARFAIAAAESTAASAVRRSALAGSTAETPVARVCDLPAMVSTLRGKV